MHVCINMHWKSCLGFGKSSFPHLDKNNSLRSGLFLKNRGCLCCHSLVNYADCKPFRSAECMVWCAQSVQCMICCTQSVQSMVCCTVCTVYGLLYTVCTVYGLLYTVCTVYSLLYTVCTMYACATVHSNCLSRIKKKSNKKQYLNPALENRPDL